jgi:phage terminase large subunit-like protein
MGKYGLDRIQAGRKVKASSEPLDLSMLPPKHDYRRAIAFIERFVYVTKGHGAGKPLKLQTFQRQILKSLFPTTRKRPRQGLTLIPRGNGKSTLAAAVAVWQLFDGGDSAQVLCVAVDLRQAGIVFGQAAKFIEKSPDLAARATVYQDRVKVPGSDSEMFPLPCNEAALQGYDPSFAVVDEAAFVDPAAIEAVLGSTGKRASSLVWLISTPPLADDNFVFGIVEQPEQWATTIFTSDKSHAADCEHCWKTANPALGKFLALDGLRSSFKTMRESTFRRMRLGQFIAGAEDAFIQREEWAALEQPGEIPDGSRVILGFDGSYSGDTTALVAVSIGPRPHIDLLKVWDPSEHGADYRVPVLEVEDAIRAACKRYKVAEIVCDPSRWQRSMAVLAGDGLPVVEFPQSPARMEPAVLAMHQAIREQGVTHSGNPVLTRHFINARVTNDNGTKLRKDDPKSEKRIDAAVCAVMAYSRAHWHFNKTKSSTVRTLKYAA